MKKIILVFVLLLITISLPAQVKIKGGIIGKPYYGKKSFITTVAGVKGEIHFSTTRDHILYKVVFTANNKAQPIDVSFFADAVIQHYKLGNSNFEYLIRSVFGITKNGINYEIEPWSPTDNELKYQTITNTKKFIELKFKIYDISLGEKWRKEEDNKKLNDF